MGGTPVLGGSQLGLIRFVSPDGAAVGPMPGCTSSYIFQLLRLWRAGGRPGVPPRRLGGAVVPPQPYGKDRAGLTLDEEWFAAIGAAGSTLGAGI